MSIFEIPSTPKTQPEPPPRAPAARTEGLARALGRLYQHFSRRRRVQLVLVGALTLLGALAELVTIGAVLPFLALVANPAATANLPVIGNLVVRLQWTDGDLLLVASLMLGALAVVAAGVRLLLAWASQKFVFRLGHDIGIEVYRRTLYQPYPYHIDRNSSALIADIEKVEAVVRSLLMPLMYSITSAVIATFILVGLFAIDVGVALATLGGFGAIYLGVSLMMRRRLRANSKIIALSRNERIKTVQEGLGSIRDVILDKAQPVYLRKFEQIDTAFRDAQTVSAFIGTAPRFLLEAAGMILIAATAIVLARGPGGLAEALPVLGALALGAQRLLPLLQIIYNGWANVAGNRHNLLDVVEVLDQPLPVGSSNQRKVAPLAFEKAVTLEKVGFRYASNAPFAVRGIDLTIPKGARLGLVGKTGSGKSTLIDIIMGLLNPTEGKIKVDGVELTPLNVPAWQTRIAHVPQAIYLADTSIAENIAFGVRREHIEFDRLREASRLAAISDHIEALRDGYDTGVGERGVRLSGGQRQRIGIARALYREADVLILDEATSALDVDTEIEISETIASIDKSITVILVTHRASSLVLCDHVFELDRMRPSRLKTLR